ncbi:hypothetical protein CW304_32185 [Bacillus sp. UFRGS-B20]|nr:hypothetical protein CW304_32185 [Bacillus sp. UFRGS-B20]
MCLRMLSTAPRLEGFRATCRAGISLNAFPQPAALLLRQKCRPAVSSYGPVFLGCTRLISSGVLLLHPLGRFYLGQASGIWPDSFQNTSTHADR